MTTSASLIALAAIDQAWTPGGNANNNNKCWISKCFPAVFFYSSFKSGNE